MYKQYKTYLIWLESVTICNVLLENKLQILHVSLMHIYSIRIDKI